MIPKQQIPTQDEFDDAYCALYQISGYMKMIYGVPRPTLEKVLKFLYKLGQGELDKIESLKYQPRMKAPKFPEYVMEGNELVMVHKHLTKNETPKTTQ
jgi:hypothetical protein